MEIPGLGLQSSNCGAVVGASATDWLTRVYANRCESQFEEGVRLWEAAIPKLNSWERSILGAQASLPAGFPAIAD
jgi:hypothetical protein